MKTLKLLILTFLLLSLSACDMGLRQMGPTEYGAKFRVLPRFLGGGLSSKLISPGELSVVWPWERIYKVDTALKGISWGTAGENNADSNKKVLELVHTRSLDGNEVALAVTVRYQVHQNPESINKLLQYTATEDSTIEDVVAALARSDIRAFLNELKTSEYLDSEHRYKAVDNVKASLYKQLSPLGIDVQSVILNDFRFERLLPNGDVDDSYQERLNEIQRLREQTEREKNRVDTVIAKKQYEYNEALAEVNRMVAEAEGYSKQSKISGDSYLASRQNEAKGVLAEGKSQAEGMMEQVKALSGPGGRALLKLDLVKQLTENHAGFVVVGQGNNSQGQNNGISVSKVDMNDILTQTGLLEGLSSQKEASSQKNTKK